MILDENLENLEKTLKKLSIYEKQGLDLSYLKSFIKNYKTFIKINDIQPDYIDMTEKKKLSIIKTFLEDKKVFPRIVDIIEFVNNELYLNFKSQNASREATIQRIIKRIEKNPEIKTKLKNVLQDILNNSKTKNNKLNNNLSNSDDLFKWAEMLKDI